MFKKTFLYITMLIAVLAFSISANAFAADTNEAKINNDNKTATAPEGAGDELMPPPPMRDGEGPEMNKLVGHKPPDFAGGPDNLGDNGFKGHKMNPLDFLKKLKPEQRAEAKKVLMLIKSYNDMSELCMKNNNLDEAVVYVKKIVDIKIPDYFPKEEIANQQKIFSMKVIELYIKAGKDDMAVAEAQKLISQSSGDLELSAMIYNRLAQIYKAKGNNAKAGEFLKKSIDVLEKELKK